MKRTGKNNLIYLMALILVIIAFIAFATYGMLDGSKTAAVTDLHLFGKDLNEERKIIISV